MSRNKAKQVRLNYLGTGRAGTSFLMLLFARLGLDTGFDSEIKLADPISRARLERDLRNRNCPYLVNDPRFCLYADEILSCPDVVIDHVLIPIRDLDAAALSRNYVNREAWRALPVYRRLARFWQKRTFRPQGGLWNASDSKTQRLVLLEQLYGLLLSLSAYDVPVTFLQYPKLVLDESYCFRKLRDAINGVDDFERFVGVFRQIADANLVHQFTSGDVAR